jgi:cell division protein FtsI/penicillin-binding protein 2
MNPKSVLRIRILLVLICAWALVIGAKLYFLQIVKGEEYLTLRDKQYSSNASTIFNRGTIFFESKAKVKVSAATIKEGYTLVMNPKLLSNPGSAYDAITQYVSLDRADFMMRAAKVDDQYEELGKKLDPSVGISIGELKIPGINVFQDNWRIYPGAELASHTIGLVGFDSGNEIAGRYGLERYYEDVLQRKDAGRNVNFFAELFSNIQGTSDDVQKKQGDIVATIDPTIQSELEKILRETQDAWKSDSIGGIIMDPSTGEIAAMAARPTFDPNNLKDVSDPKVFSNPLVEDVYEMGSILKPLTMAAGIDSKAITAETTYNDTGSLLLNSKKISNYDGKARGVIPMQEVLSQSLNVGAATIALKVGLQDFTRYFLSFGMGEITGIDQPNEQKGIVDNLKSGREIEQATASYGQGIAFSPIATVRALSILANGGMLIRPHIVKEIDYKDGTKTLVKPNPGVRVIQKKTAEEVTGMLIKVVDTAIAKLHPDIRMEHYSIAAKTGTAQIADHVNGGYYSDRYLHSFFGYFPAYSPRYIVFLYQVYPKGAQYASETLTKPFIELSKFLINYEELPPDR